MKEFSKINKLMVMENFKERMVYIQVNGKKVNSMGQGKIFGMIEVIIKVVI